MPEKAQHFLLNYFGFKYIKQYLSGIFPAFLICISAITISCTGDIARKTQENLRFSIFGNTFPETPYTAIGIQIEPAINKINEDNPLFAVHIGDVVCGGTRWTGINKNDIEKQYGNFYNAAKNLKPMLYNIIGELDFFSDSPEIFSLYTKRKDYYSFNYGNIHFIVLNTTDPSPGQIGNAQTEWLKGDLDMYKNSQAIFIFAHHPMFVPKREPVNPDDMVRDSASLHKLFLKYPVRAVFSGHLQAYYREEINNISYITAGCGDYDKKSGYARSSQYYIIDYSHGAINVLAKRS